MKRTTLNDLSVVIPVAPGDVEWMKLLPDLKNLPLAAEILFVGPEVPSDAPKLLASIAGGRVVRWLQSPRGRAVQLNHGAKSSKKPYLWFLHADSQLSRGGLLALEASLQRDPGAIHYFDLEFRDGPSMTRLNDLGVWFRSHVLGLPFGDQGFCMSREVFERLQGFPESAPYGEDHLLIWKARKAGVPVICTKSVLKTSARKYVQNGWLQTTLRHGALTWKQALPEWVKGANG